MPKKDAALQVFTHNIKRLLFCQANSPSKKE